MSTGKTRENEKKAFMSAYDVSITAMFVVILAVCAWISIPTPTQISFTLQTFAVCFGAAMLGFKRGMFAIIAYIALGALGVPVFSGFVGFAALAGPTAGYIVGFVFTTAVVGLQKTFFNNKIVPLIISMIIGVLLCYVCGTLWFYVYAGGSKTIGALLSLCVVPYLLWDGLKIALAALLSWKLNKYVK